MADETVVIRSYASAIEAQVSQLVLEANDIPSAVLRDDAGGMLPVMSVLFPVRLVVRREDEPRARALLDGGDDEALDDASGDDAPDADE